MGLCVGDMTMASEVIGNFGSVQPSGVSSI